MTVIAVLVGLLLAALLGALAGTSPGETLWLLLSAGFGCSAQGPCGLLTTFQFTTPLVLSGLSAVIAIRSGVFSIGQAGQMLLGAAGASLLGSRLHLPPALHICVALAAGTLFGAAWGWIPGILKAWLNVHEVIVTLVMNQLAPFAIGGWAFGRVAASARLPVLAPNTKLSAGFPLALLAAVGLAVWLWRTGAGYEQRMQGDAPLFSLHGGVSRSKTIVRGMLLSGGAAGLAGAIEVLGVHYRMVSNFSGGAGYDALMVGMLGQLHPLGALGAAFLMAGIRVGALNGLQIQAQVPRELGGAMIAVMVIVVSSQWLAFAYPRLANRLVGFLPRFGRRLQTSK
jgi:ABC-type uncharacterized transport system permease subunit